MVHTGEQLRQHAHAMRHAPTRSEERIWSWLRDRRLDGYKFKRQFPIGRYVIDFSCPELKLGIELDGPQHETSWMAEYDGQRSLELAALGIGSQESGSRFMGPSAAFCPAAGGGEGS